MHSNGGQTDVGFCSIWFLFGVRVSDKDRPFVSTEMEQFLKKLGVQHVCSSPRYHQENGMVERFHWVLLGGRSVSL